MRKATGIFPVASVLVVVFAYLGFYPGCGPHLLRGARLCVFVAAGFAASTAVTCQPPRTRAAPEIARTIAKTQRFDIAEKAVEYERTPKPKDETETSESQVFKLVAKEAVAGLSEVVLRDVMSFIVATPFESVCELQRCPEVEQQHHECCSAHPVWSSYFCGCVTKFLFPQVKHNVYTYQFAHIRSPRPRIDPDPQRSPTKTNCKRFEKTPLTPEVRPARSSSFSK